MATTSHDLIDVPLATFKTFARHIADHGLWDEVEAHLAHHGMTSLPLGRHAIEAITAKLGDHARASKLALMSCGCVGGGKGDGGVDVNKNAGGGGGGIIPPGGTWSPDGGVKGPSGGDGGSDGGD